MIIGIVAVDRNLAIGKGGKLPWHYSADLKFFKEMTSGNAVVMGNRTWRTLKRPLPKRMNIVLSRGVAPPTDSVVVLPDIQSVLALAGTLTRDLYVIGGATIYQAFLPYIEQWVVTEVPISVDGADTFMPADFLSEFDLYEVRQLEEGLRVKFYERTR
jgi:dihydrofolate reductase